jgi:hypothetical protein
MIMVARRYGGLPEKGHEAVVKLLREQGAELVGMRKGNWPG